MQIKSKNRWEWRERTVISKVLDLVLMYISSAFFNCLYSTELLIDWFCIVKDFEYFLLRTITGFITRFFIFRIKSVKFIFSNIVPSNRSKVTNINFVISFILRKGDRLDLLFSILISFTESVRSSTVFSFVLNFRTKSYWNNKLGKRFCSWYQ